MAPILVIPAKVYPILASVVNEPGARQAITYADFHKALVALRFTPTPKGGFAPPSGLPNTIFYPFHGKCKGVDHASSATQDRWKHELEKLYDIGRGSFAVRE
ncbi:hypothetical protein C8Q76DRAFT_797992 [Earliella scabrosa]|nr:hypothetical protein C8Q76DRAFT_797992 [Earliella scabrosa]